MHDKKKLTVSILIAIFIAIIFWSQSRLPQLNEKAQMGERNNITALAFDIIYPAEITDNYLVRSAKTATNWAYTNWKGMAFGLLFAAMMLTVFRYLPPWKTSKSNFFNSLKGIISGIPLSVCVNCTTPIAYGMHRSGVNLVTVLSTLMSAPTLNIIVLTISFTLLPWHLASLKLISSMIFILFIMPWLVKRLSLKFPPNDKSSAKISGLQRQSQLANTASSCEFEPPSSSWLNALSYVLKACWRNGYIIIKSTLPLMLVAGLLGALLIEALPTADTHMLVFGFGTLLFFALVGILLPVPIAFDIIAVVSLLAIGLPAGLAMALLFSLGIFSIYPALIIAQNIALRLSMALLAIVFATTLLVGFTGQYIDEYVKHNRTEALTYQLKQQRSDEIMQLLADSCQFEANEQLRQSCFIQFLKVEHSNELQTESCSRLSDTNQNVIDSCMKTINYNQVINKAKSTLNIQHCMSLTNLELQGKCWLDYAQFRALEPKALDYCDAFSNPNVKKQCTTNIVFYRVARIQNATACDGLPSSREKNACLDHLSAMLRSLSGNITNCEQLIAEHQIKSCKKNVFLMAIDDQQDYQICAQLTAPDLIQQCQNYSNFDRARQQGDSKFCQQILDKSLQQRCFIFVEHHKIKQKLINPDIFEQQLAQIKDASISSSTIPKGDMASKSAPALEWHDWYQDKNIVIQSWKHQQRKQVGGLTFIKRAGRDVGLDYDPLFNFTDFFEPFAYSRGIATGDINNDHWPDIVVATANGPAIFINKGDGSFSRQAFINNSSIALNTLVVTFVDVNNDGWQDLFTSNYGGDNLIYWNKNGKFDHNNVLTETVEARIATMAAGFGDWDKDGDIDYVAGNWSYGTEGAFNPEHSFNHWLENNGTGFDLEIPDELPGETLSILLSDIDQDDYLDLMVANDREYPDHYYKGSKSGFQVHSGANGLPVTPLNNMSIESADFNNDLRLDLFSVDMSFGISKQADYCAVLTDQIDQKNCKELLKGYSNIQNKSVNGCAELDLAADKKHCLIALAIQIANQNREPLFCQQIPKDMPSQRTLCETLSNRGSTKPPFSAMEYIPQKQQNVLLIRQQDGSLRDMTESMRANDSMWSWNAKAADLDNDQWQDIYIGNGFEFGTKNNEIHSNVFLHNQKGVNFVQSQQDFGLTDYTNTSNYSYADIDLDGDIDIIAGGAMSMPRVFVNQTTKNNSITFTLQDNIGNRYCIGCKIIIHYGNGLHQIRELKLSGGFQSFDVPVVHFGLGDHTKINSVDIIWSTGQRTTVNTLFTANSRYLIKNKPN